MIKKKMIIIGANGSGYKRTIPAMKDSEICEIVAIQSRNGEKLKSICKEYNIKNYYTDISEILKNEEFDLIYIANPPFMHLDTIKECIKTNKPIICEKPLARDYKEALEIKKLVQEKNIPIMIAHHLRHQKAFMDIKKMINSQKIGDVVSCWGQWGFAIKPQAASSVWKLDKNLGGGGTFSDNGIHVIDFIIGLFGIPEKVIGNSRLNSFKETYGNETMMMIYKDKDATINSSHIMPYAGNHLLIYGTKGSIEVYGAMSEKAIKQIIIKTDEGEEKIDYVQENLYKNEVEDFVKYYFNNDKTAICDTNIDDGILALKLIEDMRKQI